MQATNPSTAPQPSNLTQAQIFEVKKKRYTEYIKNGRFFLDIQAEAERKVVVRQITFLKGTVDIFFTKSVTCIISETGKPDEFVRSRAEQWKIRTISLSQFKAAMQKYFSGANNIGQTVSNNTASVSVQTVHQLSNAVTSGKRHQSVVTVAKNDFVEFSHPFVVVSDSAFCYKPLYKEYNEDVLTRKENNENKQANSNSITTQQDRNMPGKQPLTKFPFFPLSHLIVTNCGGCPFYIDYEKLPFTQTFYKRKTLLDNFPTTKAREMKPLYEPLMNMSREQLVTTLAPKRTQLIKSLQEKRSQAEALIQKKVHSGNYPEHVHNTNAKPEKQDLAGFCECCCAKFTNLKEHLNSAGHQEYAANNSNYVNVDRLSEELLGGSNSGILEKSQLSQCMFIPCSHDCTLSEFDGFPEHLLHLFDREERHQLTHMTPQSIATHEAIIFNGTKKRSISCVLEDENEDADTDRHLRQLGTMSDIRSGQGELPEECSPLVIAASRAHARLSASHLQTPSLRTIDLTVSTRLASTFEQLKKSIHSVLEEGSESTPPPSPLVNGFGKENLNRNTSTAATWRSSNATRISSQTPSISTATRSTRSSSRTNNLGKVQ